MTTAEAITTGDGIVQIAYLHSEHPSHSWVESMRIMLDHDLRQAVAAGADLAHCIENGYRIARKPLNMRCGAGLVAQTRNYAARLFLDKTDHEWLLFIDTDMGFAPDAAHRLLEVADPVERPVVGALCFAFMEAAFDGMGGWRRTIVPTMYRLGTTTNGDPSFCFYGDYEDDTVTQVAATGGAFLLIHRSVLEKLRAEHGDHWFDMFYDSAGDVVGEDFAFCARALNVGVVPVVHTGVKTTHHKEIWLSEEDYLAQQATTVAIDPTLTIHIDLQASLASLAANAHVREDGMLKLGDDLARYQQIIEATRPEVIVETGTRTGASARWFAELGPDVVTVDIDPDSATGVATGAGELTVTEPEDGRGGITWVKADSADPTTASGIAAVVNGRRCMVVLDSDHSAAHVAKEIDLYGPLVSPGCYLVAEDGIFGYAPLQLRAMHVPGQVGSPLDAIVAKLHDNPGWSRDVAIERTSPVSHHPAGWWIRLETLPPNPPTFTNQPVPGQPGVVRPVLSEPLSTYIGPGPVDEDEDEVRNA